MRVAAAVLVVAFAGCASVPTAAPPPPVAPVPSEAARRTPRAARPPPAPRAQPVADQGVSAPAPAPDVPDQAAAPVAEEGVASYYADSLAGRRTASGERYRPDAATCAHRTHKFGTRLIVTAIDSGRSAACRVNDRGPWVEGRVLDVSKSIAKELGMIGPGLLRVRIAVSEDQAQ